MSSIVTVTGLVTKPDPSMGDLQKDENGYYLVNLGVFNGFNTRNEFYRVRDIKGLLENTDSVFFKKLSQGYLNGEANHPVRLPGMTDSEYYFRNISISMDNISHHIRNLELRELDTPCNVPGAGKPTRVLGWVKPVGKHGLTLEDMLNNKEQNVAFSIRCVTAKPQIINGVMVKDIIEVITWDWVDAPGISKANKWSTIAKESDNHGLNVDLDYNLNIDLDNINFDLQEEVHVESDVVSRHNDIYNSYKNYNCNGSLSSRLLLNW